MPEKRLIARIASAAAVVMAFAVGAVAGVVVAAVVAPRPSTGCVAFPELSIRVVRAPLEDAKGSSWKKLA